MKYRKINKKNNFNICYFRLYIKYTNKIADRKCSGMLGEVCSHVNMEVKGRGSCEWALS